MPKLISTPWVTDITERKRIEEARDDLLRRLATLQEDERRRISRELHDTFGQLLTALSLSLKATRETPPLSSATLTRLDNVQEMVNQLHRVVHNVAVRLRPTALDDVGLHAALAQYFADWSTQTGIGVDYEGLGMDISRLSADVETAIYRIVLEALTNVARHAKARRVSVIVSRQDDGFASVAVEDDGSGFDPEAAAASGRLGIIGMQERAMLAGGKLEIESRPGSGTTVLARFPISHPGGRQT